MTGKGYYITTIGDWKRRAGAFANSHWLLLGDATGGAAVDDAAARSKETGVSVADIDESRQILVLVEADEGMHGALEDDGAFEALPHPLSNKPISERAQSALAAHGVRSGASTFEATEIVARVHPLLKHRVF